MDGGLLRPLNRDQTSPAGPLTLLVLWLGTRRCFTASGAAAGCASHLPTHHSHSRILLMGGQNHCRLSLRTRQGMGTGTELSWWWGGITWELLAGIPASLTAASEPLPCASRPPKGFPPSNENSQSNKLKTWERPDCFIFMLKNLAQQDFSGAECSQRCLRLGGNAACAVGDQGSGKGLQGECIGEA